MSAGLVRRPRLTNVLEDSLAFGIALVVAPAGYGKSIVIEDVCGDLGIRVDLSDAETPEAFARTLIASAAPQHERSLGAFLARPLEQRPSRKDGGGDELAVWIGGHLSPGGPPIILDDFHKINDRLETVRLIERVICSTIPHVRWVIASRETPPLPVGTWVAHGMGMPLVGDDLAFTTKEATELAQALKLGIGAQDLRTIWAEAEGWPLIIRLALAAWERTRTVVSLRIRTRNVLYDFLEEQVWTHLTDGDRALLLAAAALRDIRPAFLSRIGFVDPGPALEALGRKLPLVARFGSTGFRLHDVFRDFVLERHPQPEIQDTLQSAAVDAYVATGDIRRALAIAVQGQAPARIRDLLARHACELLAGGHRAGIAAAVAAIKRTYPDDVVMVAVHGLVNASEGNDKAAEEALRAVADAPELEPYLRTAVRMRLAELSLKRGDAQSALAISEPLVGVADEFQIDWLGMSAAAHGFSGSANLARERLDAATRIGCTKQAGRAQHLLRLAFAHFYLGDMVRAETFAHDAAEIAEADVTPAIAARAFSILYAVATLIHIDGRIALHHARQWSRFAEEAGERSTLALGLVAVSATAAELGDDDTFVQAVERLRPLRTISSGRHQVPLRYARAVYEIGQQNFRNAILAIGTLDPLELGAPEKSFRDALIGMLHAANGESDIAEPFLRKMSLVLNGTNVDSREHGAFAVAYRSLGLWLIGRQAEAQRAFVVQATQGLGERDAVTLNVIRSICSTPASVMSAAKLEELTLPLIGAGLHGFARFFRTLVRPGSAAKLTRTELAVLAEYRRGRSTAEIASHLKRSPKTLYNHVDSASRKLGVSGRAAVLAVVVDQGLID